MAVKTITIDLEAYEQLARRKTAGESFSQVIKKHFRRQPTVADFKAIVRKVRLSDETLDAIEDQIRGRRRSPVRIPKL
jgi:predicted CopG family antitoxin